MKSAGVPITLSAALAREGVVCNTFDNGDGLLTKFSLDTCTGAATPEGLLSVAAVGVVGFFFFLPFLFSNARAAASWRAFS